MDTISDSGQEAPAAPAFPHRSWRDYPVAGVDFPDATTVTRDSGWIQMACTALASHLGEETELIAGIDIGGIGLAGALAFRSRLGFIDIRKVGSIRADVVRSLAANYELGNGVALSKGHQLAGHHVALIDDCLMSGGTALAAAELLRRLGAHCTRALFVFELEGLGGRERLAQAGIAMQALERLPAAEPRLAPAG